MWGDVHHCQLVPGTKVVEEREIPVPELPGQWMNPASRCDDLLRVGSDGVLFYSVGGVKAGSTRGLHTVRFTQLTKWGDAWVNFRRRDSEVRVPDHYLIQKKT